MNNEILTVLSAWSRIKTLSFDNIPDDTDHDKLYDCLTDLGDKINSLKQKLLSEKKRVEEENNKSFDDIGNESDNELDEELNNFINQSYTELNYLGKYREIIIIDNQ
jgi:hypothetical protein